MAIEYSPGQVQWRVFEKDMLEKHFGSIRNVSKLKEILTGDVCFWRPNTEFTSERSAEIMAKYEDRFVFNVNKPSSFKYSHAKDCAFEKWDEVGVPCPKHFSFDCVEDFESKLDSSGIEFPLLIRVNNENTGKGSWLVKRKEDSLAAARDCLDLKNSLSSTEGTRAICVELIDTISERKYNHSFRIIVAGEKVICGYARVSSRADWVAITGKYTPEMREDFIYWNKQCEKFCTENKDLIVKSVRSLGLNHQGVDVILDSNLNPYFLEVQPGYSTGYATWPKPFYNPGYPDLVEFLLKESEYLSKEIPLYYNVWLDKKTFFDLAYAAIREEYEASIC